ncbi:hypothetical protein B9Z55_017593 [Caenorhabditis nigoni]|uniref:ATP-dependent DNA helicase n=2 Tax=Caenorhabditis nigoni TaxID=1611254 RepID=A0A2G5TAE7_9PELO|nr:hypothetical protein B9Z55_017593 [Caenorhabditis nigoni]
MIATQDVYDFCLKMLQDKKQFFVFLQGRGGTGKTHTIRRIAAALKPSQYLLMSATNTGAREIGGETIYKALKIPLNLFDTDSIKYAHCPDLEFVVFDEVSMLAGKLLKFLDKALRKKTGKKELFGGCSVLLSGDLRQLSVGDDRIFQADNWHLFERIELKKSIRHTADQEFADRLSRWAEGEVHPWDLQFFKKRELCPDGLDYKTVAQAFLAFPPGKNVILCANGEAVDRFNEAIVKEIKPNQNVQQTYRHVLQKKMERVRGPPHYEEQEQDGCFHVAEGLAVLFTGQMVSTENFRVKSGTHGVILGFEKDDGLVNRLRIEIHGRPYHFIRHYIQQPIYGNLRSLVSLRFELVNAYACVVHRAQGMTLDKAIVDTSNGLGTSMGYTAFSRVRTAADLFITHLPKKTDFSELRHIITADELVTGVLAEQPLLDLMPKSEELVKENKEAAT